MKRPYRIHLMSVNSGVPDDERIDVRMPPKWYIDSPILVHRGRVYLMTRWTKSRDIGITADVYFRALHSGKATFLSDHLKKDESNVG